MATHYRGERIADLLALISAMEERLKAITADVDPFSLAQYGEVAHGYTALAIAKAKLTALQKEKL